MVVEEVGSVRSASMFAVAMKTATRVSLVTRKSVISELDFHESSLGRFTVR